jgi:hypothetical protein
LVLRWAITIIKDPVVVDEHALSEVFLFLRLDLTVERTTSRLREQNESLFAIELPGFDQFVGHSATDLGFRDQALQFFVEEFDGTIPVDEGVDFGKKKARKGWK